MPRRKPRKPRKSTAHFEESIRLRPGGLFPLGRTRHGSWKSTWRAGRAAGSGPEPKVAAIEDSAMDTTLGRFVALELTPLRS